MKTLLLNNTSKYHKGCVKVVEAIQNIYGFDDSYFTNDDTSKVDVSQYDRVILNGEGTMHHNASRAIQLLTTLDLAQKAGCETHIINSVWQKMPNTKDHVLKACDSITVREIFSQQEISKHGVKANIHPDLSYMIEVPTQEYEHVSVYEGQYLGPQRSKGLIGKYPRIDIFNQEWNEIVNRLRNCDLLITGRHHEMYAACKAECRFLVRPGNTWKNEGLLKTVGVEIPWDIEGVLNGKYDDQYKLIWEYLNNYK